MADSASIIPRERHGIQAEKISVHARKVVERLQQAGYLAYVVGGSIRDLLLGFEPKDFDVATSATPEEVRRVFRNARLIGRRFRLAHVRFGREIIEVATFRGDGNGKSTPHRELEDGRLVRDNVWGSEQEDACRRDFTINAMMYDPATGEIRDHVGGYEDLQARRLRLIGDPVTRYREDPVRLLRAVRFMVKLDLELDPPTAAPISEMAELLEDIPPARLFEEILKLFMTGRAWPSYQALVQFNLWEPLFPNLFDDPSEPPLLVERALQNTDERVAEGKPVTPAFLFAALLWRRVEDRAGALMAGGEPAVDALLAAGEEAVAAQARRVAIHRRFSGMAKEIWGLQPRFENRQGRRVSRLLGERRFRAAYDFLLLRALENPELQELADWWTSIQEVEGDARREMVRQAGGAREGGRPGRRRRRRRPRRPQGETG